MAFRRVTHYPLHWRDLSTAELELISHVARAIHPGGRRATMALREFVGDDGREWRVWDTRPQIPSPNVNPSARDAFGDVPRISKKRESGWLTFTAAGDRRRLSPIPEDWETADQTSLRSMLAAADRVAGAD